MKKKIILLIFCMALAASLLTACGKKAQTLEQYCKDNGVKYTTK